MCHDCPKRGLAQEGTPNDEPWSLYEAAYRQYQSEVRNGGKRYDRFVTDFIHSHTFIATCDAAVLNEHYKNVMALKEMLETRRDLVGRFFSNGTFTKEDFRIMHRLFNTTEALSPSTRQKRKALPPPASFGSRFSDGQISLITQCVNGAGLFCEAVTNEDIKGFFCCQLEKPLVIAQGSNRRFAMFMDALRGERLIALPWQKAIEDNALVLSSGKKHQPMTAKNISHALSMAKRHGHPSYDDFTALAKKLKEMPEKAGNPSK